jgi:MFS family permease
MSKSYKKFLFISISQIISTVGSGITTFALAIHTYQLTSSVISVSLVTIASFLPIVLLNPLGGLLADRFDRKLMMIIGDSGSMFGLFTMFVLLKLELLNMTYIIICLILSSVFSALLEPAYKSLVSEMLSKEEYAKASGIIQLASAAKFLIAPFIGGMLMANQQLDLVLIIDISTFFLTVASVSLIRKHQRNAHVKYTKLLSKQQVFQGYFEIKKNAGVFYLVLLLTGVTFFAGYYQILITPLLLNLANEKTLGYIQSISAIGLLLSSLILSIKNRSQGFFKMLFQGLFMMSIALFITGLSKSLWIIGLSSFVILFSLPLINTSAEVLIRKHTDVKHQGSVWGMIGFITQTGYMIAYFTSGYLTEKVFVPLSEKPVNIEVLKYIAIFFNQGIGSILMLIGLFMMIFTFGMFKNTCIRNLENAKELNYVY